MYFQQNGYSNTLSLRALCGVAVFALSVLLGSSGASQGTISADPQLGPPRNVERDAAEEKMENDRKKAMNKHRHELLQKDTDRLYQLAGELKGYVDKTDENMLSVDVVKKAEEVEKLAKKVKDKMKETY